MDWTLGVEYVKALAWPVVVIGLVLFFRTEIRQKIGQLKKADTPVGSAEFTQRVTEAADDAAEVAEMAEKRKTKRPSAPSGDEHEPPTGVHIESDPGEQRDKVAAIGYAVSLLEEPTDFVEARSILPVSPSAAVMLAYIQLEKVVRGAWVAQELRRPLRPEGVRKMLRDLSEADQQLYEVVDELTDLRNRVAHGQGEPSHRDASTFIDACETVAATLVSTARSKLRHPSRSALMHEHMQRDPQERADDQDR